MMNRICASVLAMGIVFWASATMASVEQKAELKAKITSVSYDEKAKGIVVEFSRKMPYQLIQVDDREFLLAVKNVDIQEGLPVVKDDDVMVASISTDRLPGDIAGLVIHTKKAVTHDSNEWDETSGCMIVHFKYRRN